MPIVLFYTISDADGDKSRVEFPVDDEFLTLANIPTLIEDVWDLINPLTNANLVNAGFSFEVDIAGFTSGAGGALGDVQEKAEFVFRTVAGFLKRINLPVFIETLFGSAGASKDVNLADTDVAAFVAAMTDGIDVGGDTVLFTDYHGDALDTLEAARENWGKNRR